MTSYFALKRTTWRSKVRLSYSTSLTTWWQAAKWGKNAKNSMKWSPSTKTKRRRDRRATRSILAKIRLSKRLRPALVSRWRHSTGRPTDCSSSDLAFKTLYRRKNKCPTKSLKNSSNRSNDTLDLQKQVRRSISREMITLTRFRKCSNRVKMAKKKSVLSNQVKLMKIRRRVTNKMLERHRKK